MKKKSIIIEEEHTTTFIVTGFEPKSFCEKFIYNYNVSDSDRKIIIDYLDKKWSSTEEEALPKAKDFNKGVS